jgi:predicted outer membrane repeat protein
MARRFLVLLVGSFLFCSSVRAATWLIKPDGSGDAPTIQAGIDGGAIYCEEPCSPTFTECIFSTNDAASRGGAVCFEYAGATMSECEFNANTALDGGAIYFGIEEAYYRLEGSIFSENFAATGGALNCQHGASVSTDRCTFCRNEARSGSGVYFLDTYLPGTLDNSIIAFGKTGCAIWCATAGSLPLLTCCDVCGNQGGDWVGCIAGQQGLNGNIREDPLFCDPSNGDFQLDCSSPCKDGYDCGRIGACGVGCGASVLLPTTWSAIKSIYR